MKIVDRYVFYKFVRIFVLCYVALVGIYVVFDLFNNLSKFIEASGSGNILATIFEYYFLNSFVFVDVIFPILIVLAATASTSLMARQNELIALLATGVSPIRTIAPILIGAALISGAFTGVREWFLPARLVELTFSPDDFVKRSDTIPAVCSFDPGTNISLDGKDLIRSEGRIVEPRVKLGRNLNKYGSRIVAESALYRDAEGARPGGWLLRGVSAPEDLGSKSSLVAADLGGEPVVFFPGDSQWLGPDEIFIATSIDFMQMAAGELRFLYGSTRDLNDALKNAKTRDAAVRLAIRAHSRALRPFADLLPLLLGVPFVFFRSDRNVFASLGAGMLLAGGYVAAQYASVYLGERFSSATFGVWAPFFLFGPVAAYMIAELTKKGSKNPNSTQ